MVIYMLKKVMCGILAFSIVSSLCVCGYAKESVNDIALTDIPGYVNIVKDEVSQINILDDLPTTYSLNNKYIIHNEGAPIESDYFVEGKNEGNYLVAVTIENESGEPTKHAYFSDTANMNLNELNDYISSVSDKQIKAARSGDYETYSWKFRGNTSTDKYTTLTTVLNYERVSSTTKLDGKTASIWDFTALSQFEKKNAKRINKMVTRLDVDQSAQTLLDFGPRGSASGGQVSVSLSGGVPTLSYDFPIDGYSIKNKSSLTGKYGRWEVCDNVGNVDSFEINPGIRASNTSGNMVLELSHTTNFSPVALNEDHGTGVIQLILADR